MLKNISLDAECIFEKKKWISITGLCNNNCKFCLDKDRADKKHRELKEIKEEILKAKEEGNNKLILSGGDPTIHPNIIDLIEFGKKTGFKKIQIITNGRMFAKREWAEKIINAGLDEITLSIHGYNPKIHDSLTSVPGSFIQIIKGIKNIRSNKKKIILNTDTCITKLNYKFIPKTIRFIVEVVGIKEINLMTMVPQGNAWKNKEEIMCSYEKIAPYVYKVIDYCKNSNTVLWLSRFPPEYLENYKEFIPDSYHLIEDIRGCSKNTFEEKTNPPCLGEKCKYCGIKNICKDILKIKKTYEEKKIVKKRKEKIIEITKSNYMNLPDSERIILKFPNPKRKLKECEQIFISFEKLKPFLEEIKKSRFMDIPPCIVKPKQIIKNENGFKSDYLVRGKLNYIKIAEDLSLRLKIKKISCRECKYYSDCEGVYKKYFRVFGFEEIKPIK